MKAWQIYWRGACMGAADLVPGISGGTVALILGIYPRLIAALASFKPSLFTLWRKQGFAAVWLAVDANFLLSLLLGIVTSIALLAHLLSYLLLNFPLHLNGVFFGLVAASAWVVAKEVNSYQLSSLLALILGVLVASLLPKFLPSLGNLSPVTFFLGGAIAICAMLLPGISGSFLLLSLGLYQPVIEALKALNLLVIASFATGALVGILVFSQVLNWLLKNFKLPTFAFLLGFILASLKNLWPWQRLISYRVSLTGEIQPLETSLLLPQHYTALTDNPSFYLSVSLLMAISFLAVALLSKHK